jgi:hypothetical protein
MHCSLERARAICDQAAQEHEYHWVDQSNGLVRYTPERRHRRVPSLPELEAYFRHEMGQTTVTIVGHQPPKLQRLLRPTVSVRSEVVVFRDQLWCHAAQAQIAAKVL